MIPSRRILLLVWGVMTATLLYGQELSVLKSPDRNKVDINTSNGIATIMFNSSVKDLSIINKEGLPVVKKDTNIWFTYIDAQNEIENKECCRTVFILKTPKTNEFLLRTEDILPGQLIYYTVILPDSFPAYVNLEYVYSPTTICGLRLSSGARYGGYLSYRWGKYIKYGNNIDDVTTDNDLANAEFLGYIRTSITGGFRMGLLNKNFINLHFIVGGGYGEYGRQWKNPMEVEKNIYFYSDYIKGGEAELAVVATAFKYITLSAGANALFGGGKVSVEPIIGFGLNLPLDVFRKGKKI